MNWEGRVSHGFTEITLMHRRHINTHPNNALLTRADIRMRNTSWVRKWGEIIALKNRYHSHTIHLRTIPRKWLFTENLILLLLFYRQKLPEIVEITQWKFKYFDIAIVRFWAKRLFEGKGQPCNENIIRHRVSHNNNYCAKRKKKLSRVDYFLETNSYYFHWQKWMTITPGTVTSNFQ